MIYHLKSHSPSHSLNQSSKMEQQQQPPPSLKLEILQGPRKGETLHYPPGYSIQIGRVARDNNLPIKDPGISSKHLSITTESGKWVLLDLDSSNGTVLDSNNLIPHSPFDLHNGATIKIGELTSIQVTFIPHQEDIHNNKNMRRNPTRRGRTGPVEPGPKGEDFVAPVAVGVEPVAKPRRGRPAKGKGLNAIGDNESGLAGQPDNKRVTRNAKLEKRSVVEIPDNSGDDHVEVPRKTTRVTRNLKKEETVIGNSDAPNEKVEEPKNIRVTRNMKNKGIVIGENAQNSNLEECGVEKVEGKKKRGGGGGGAKKKNVLEESVKELEESKVDDEVELNHHDQDGFKESCADESKGEDCCAQEENLGGSWNWPDLEKMSLGEWFDFLEVQLPKQIIGSSEEMIDSMRDKAERLRDYITEQNNDKGKMPV